LLLLFSVPMRANRSPLARTMGAMLANVSKLIRVGQPHRPEWQHHVRLPGGDPAGGAGVPARRSAESRLPAPGEAKAGFGTTLRLLLRP
jgi:hypothetical protein